MANPMTIDERIDALFRGVMLDNTDVDTANFAYQRKLMKQLIRSIAEEVIGEPEPDSPWPWTDMVRLRNELREKQRQRLHELLGEKENQS